MRECQHCKRDSVSIHARGLCSRCYRDHREEYPRTKFHRPYTARERSLIRGQWRARPAAAIAAELGRDVRDVYAAAVRFGAAKPRRVLKTDPRLRAKLVRLHGRGLSDREIARLVGFGHGTVARWLRRLGFPSNCRTRPTDPFPERTKQKQREAARLRIERDGPEAAMPFLRKHAEGRARAIRMGWPQAETLLEALILDALFEHGPSTAAQVCDDLGHRSTWTASKVRGLKRRGLLVVLYREGRECVYALAYGLKRAEPKRSRGSKS